MAQTETLEQEIDQLYGLPLEEFTAQRDAAAKRLRSEGDHDAAAEVKRLRKPSRLAWALNQVRRHERDQVDELLAAGERLQEAQRELVQAGERGMLRTAAAEERELVGRIVGLAERELAAAGHPANPSAQSKLFSTLHAAAANSEAREALATGRLLGEYQISDLGLSPGGLADVAVPGKTRTGGKPKDATADKRAAAKSGAAKNKAGSGADKPRAAADKATATEDTARAAADIKANAAAERKARVAAEREARQITAKLGRARERSHDLARQQKQAERELADAERAAARAAAVVERAGATAERARAAAREASARVDELEVQLTAARSAA
jgi:hypothetical protein